MSSRLRSEEAIDELKKNNPYFDKYASKITALQKTSPEEFLQRVESVERNHQEPKPEKARDFAELLNPKSQLDKSKGTESTHKKLTDIMKIELLENKTADEIKQIWFEYHSKKDVLVAAIPTETYNILSARGKQYPMFIFPLPRSQGYEFFLLQFANNTVHFTPLLCYQVHKENAPECLNVAHYTEFSESLGLVLMRGEIDTNVINVQEAQCLANQLQLYYAQDSQSKLELLDRFTKQPDSFKHMDVVNELQNLTIEATSILKSSASVKKQLN